MIRSTKKHKRKYRQYPTATFVFDEKLVVEYNIPVSNGHVKNICTRKISRILPSTIRKDIFSFQILGFLQGEMSKTHRGPVTICNSDISLMKKVLTWFSEEWGVSKSQWHWYIKLNLPPIKNSACKDQLESELIEYWLASGVDYEKRFPTTLSFIKNTNNAVPSNEGSLIIERRGPVFVQTLQSLVRDSFTLASQSSKEHTVGFLQGLIAAESCINFRLKSKHRRVFISSCNDAERKRTVELLQKVGIKAKNYPSVRATIVSGKENLLRMQELDLVSLHPDKHARFTEMINSYQR